MKIANLQEPFLNIWNQLEKSLNPIIDYSVHKHTRDTIWSNIGNNIIDAKDSICYTIELNILFNEHT